LRHPQNPASHCSASPRCPANRLSRVVLRHGRLDDPRGCRRVRSTVICHVAGAPPVPAHKEAGTLPQRVEQSRLEPKGTAAAQISATADWIRGDSLIACGSSRARSSQSSQLPSSPSVHGMDKPLSGTKFARAGRNGCPSGCGRLSSPHRGGEPTTSSSRCGLLVLPWREMSRVPIASVTAKRVVWATGSAPADHS